MLSYLKSCIREVIRSGVITVGVDQSEAQDAKLERGKVDCDAGKMLAAPRQANDVAGWVSKDLQLEPTQATPVPEFTLYGLSPIFEVRGDGTLIVQRLDRADNRIVLTIFRKQLVREAFLDFLPLACLSPLAAFMLQRGAIIGSSSRSTPAPAPAERQSLGVG